MDSYFEKQDKLTIFFVLGKEAIVDDEQLIMALSRLPEIWRCFYDKVFRNCYLKQLRQVFASRPVFISATIPDRTPRHQTDDIIKGKPGPLHFVQQSQPKPNSIAVPIPRRFLPLPP